MPLSTVGLLGEQGGAAFGEDDPLLGLGAPKEKKSGGIGSLAKVGLGVVGDIFGSLQETGLHIVKAVQHQSPEELARFGMGLTGAVGGFLVGGPAGMFLGSAGGNALADAIPGFDGDERPGVVETFGLEDNLPDGFLGKAARFGLELGTDPGLFLSGGASAFSNAGRLAGAGERAALKVGLPFAPKATLVSGETAAKGNTALRGALRSADDSLTGGRFTDAAATVSDKFGRALSPDKYRIGQLLDKGHDLDTAKGVMPAFGVARSRALAAEANHINKAQAEMGAIARSAGVTVDDLPDILAAVERGENAGPVGDYIRRSMLEGDSLPAMLTPAGARALRKDPGAAGLTGRSAVKDAVRRGIPVADESTAAFGANLGKAMGTDAAVFDQNPLTAFMAMSRKQGAAHADEVFRWEMENAGVVDDLATDLTGLFRGGAAPSANKAITSWKKAATWSPAFHVRNMLSDAAKVLPEGVRGGDLAAMNALQSKLAGLSDAAVAEKGYMGAAREVLTPEEMTLFAGLRREGVLDSTFFAQEIPDTGVALSKPSTLDKARHPLKGIRSAGTRGQDLIRGGTFQAKTRQGLSTAEAGQETNRLLIDYSDLTPFQAKVRNSAMPFSTFAFKNTPVALKQAADHPGATLSAIHGEEELLPEGMRVPLTMPAVAAGDTLAPFAKLLSGDVGMAGRAAISQVSGPLAVPLAAAESGINRRLYNGLPIETENRPTRNLGIGPLRSDIPAGEFHVANSMQPWARALEDRDDETEAERVLKLLLGISKESKGGQKPKPAGKSKDPLLGL